MYFYLKREMVVIFRTFWGKKIRSLSFLTKSSDLIADKKAKNGSFGHRHLCRMSGRVGGPVNRCPLLPVSFRKPFRVLFK